MPSGWEVVDEPKPSSGGWEVVDDAPKAKSKASEPKNDRDLAAMFGYDPDYVFKRPGYKQGDLMRLWKAEGSGEKKDLGAITRFGLGALKGFEDIEAGVEQIGRRVLSGVGKYGDINLKYSELERKVKDTAYSRKSPDNTAGKVGEFVAPVLLPGGPGLQGAKVFSQQGAKQLGKIALAGGAQALTMPVDMAPGATNAEYLRKKALQAGTGTVLSPLATVGIERGIVPAAKYVARNNPLARVFGKKAVREAALERAESIRNATRTQLNPAGVEPSLGESLQNPGLNALENKAEYIPFSGRKAQLERGNVGLHEKLRELAGAESKGLGIAGPGAEIAESAKGKLAKARADLKEPYGFVREVVGDTPPVKAATIKAYDDAIAKEVGISGPNSPEVKALKGARDNFAKGETGRNFSDMESIQDRLQSDAAHNLQSPDPGVKALGRYSRDISRAIGEDMHATVAKVDPSGFTSDVYRGANKRYIKEVMKFDPTQAGGLRTTKKAAQSLVAPEGFEGNIPDKLFANDSPSMAKYAKEALDDRGHKAVRAEIMRRALAAGEDGKIFSPAKAATALDKHSNFIGEFFSPQEAQQIKGFQNALRDMQRSGQYLEGLNTGKFVEQTKSLTAPLAAVGAAYASHSPAPLVLGGGAIGLTKLYTKLSGTKAGKEWLLGMAKTKPNSKLMQSMMDRLPTIVGITAGKKVGDKPEPEQEQE